MLNRSGSGFPNHCFHFSRIQAKQWLPPVHSGTVGATSLKLGGAVGCRRAGVSN